MPDEPYFRKPETQRILLDILFIFCKLNQDVGYRQGMHELLAPILWVVEEDAINSSSTGADGIDTETLLMIDTLNASFIEHDSFTLFSLLMQSAKPFYELGEPELRMPVDSGHNNLQKGAAPIIEKSRRIHEVYLAKVDPELASHLTQIEILPQIFLM
jgi:TBC1 domain family protein 5